MRKCPECGSSNLVTERRPNGESRCINCGYRDSTSEFDEQEDQVYAAKSEVIEAEQIKHAAVKSATGWVFIGKCHADCFHKMHLLKVTSSQKADHQGFVTNTGRYVERNEAARIAKASGQVDSLPVEILFSEDLWSDQHNGKYNYDEINGYVAR